MPVKSFSRVRKTLSFRLTLWYSVTFIASSLLLFLLSYVFLSLSVRDNQKILQTRLSKLVSVAEDAGMDAAIQVAADRRNKYFVRIIAPESRTVLMSPAVAWQKFDLAAFQQRPVETGWQSFPSRTDSDALEVASVYLRNGYAFQVGGAAEDRRSKGGYRKKVLDHFRKTTMAVMTPTLLIGLAGGSFFAFRATRPVRNLIRTTQSIIDLGKIDARVPITAAEDELNELGKLFNRMLERVETLVQGMRHALDNVAHDLRTPVTRFRGIAETSLQLPSGDPAHKEALISCVEESERIMTLLNTLMDISEAETGTMKLNLAAIDVSDLIHETVELYEYVAEEREITVSSNAPESIFMRADRNRMRQVLANLLDNAIKYTPPGGSVAIDAREEGDQIVIRVQDTGAGIPPAEIPKIWNRLHRGDASRSQPGLGLGLSLVAAIVHTHNGRIEVESAVGSGSIFTLYMPCAPHMEMSIGV